MENLLRQRGELTAKIDELDRLSTTGTEKILQAIQNQRWFFFSNNKYILMDRDTALIWANLDYFPYGKTNNTMPYFDGNFYAEVKNLMRQINSQRFGGFDDWKIPTPLEFWEMIEDKSFPYQEGFNWRILEKFNWCVDWYGISRKSLDDRGATTEIKPRSAYVIPCNSVFVPKEYAQNISPSNRFYSAKEKAKFTLDIFTRNNLVPIFHDAETTRLYKKIYVDKIADEIPRIAGQISELDKKIAAAKKLAEEEAQRKLAEAKRLADEERNLATEVTHWRENNLRFETGLLGELKSICQKENLDEKIFMAWREEWRSKRFDVEQKFLSLVAFVLENNLSDAPADMLKILREYRDAVDRFYLLERTEIFLQADNKAQEKSAAANALDELTEQFRLNLQKIISACDKIEERNFLREWSESPST